MQGSRRNAQWRWLAIATTALAVSCAGDDSGGSSSGGSGGGGSSGAGGTGGAPFDCTQACARLVECYGAETVRADCVQDCNEDQAFPTEEAERTRACLACLPGKSCPDLVGGACRSTCGDGYDTGG